MDTKQDVKDKKQTSAEPQKVSDPPISQAEKQWLKDKFGGEFKFLRDYGLSIYKEEDREEGRQIMRDMMEADEDDDEDAGSETSFERECEENPMSHVADYHFSSGELSWIKKHFKHSGNFMLCYGLKPFDEEDCEEGKATVQALMKDD